MRERRPADWARDLAGRHDLEAAVAAALAAHPALTLLAAHTNALDRLDYQVLGPGERLLEIELKAKRQPYVGWAELRPEVAEADLFILDELALRRLVDAGRYGFLLVADRPSERWAVWSTAELVLASKIRTARRLASGVDRLKGKVLLDLGEAAALTSTLAGALSGIVNLIRIIDRCWSDIAPWPWPATVAVP